MTSAASRLALGGIGAYQRFLSPYKGLRCAHHARTGGMTCSNYGAQAIREYGLRAALPRIRARLFDCSQYAKDPFKGKIGEDDPGPLALRGCGPGRARERNEAHEDDCFKLFLVDLACNSCLLFPF